jgi:peroxiredoxin (alkyl hydroperoxide reductase subunit C)
MSELLRMVKGLQTTDEYKVALPANWPENELFGSDVIVPPVKDVKAAKERLEQAKKGAEFKCLDWWLCHKPLDK